VFPTAVRQWAAAPDTLEVAADPRRSRDGYTKSAKLPPGCRFSSSWPRIQFDEEPGVPTREPEFNEHGESILADIGFDEDAIIGLKILSRRRLMPSNARQENLT
jgi:hypothetical protein